MPVSYPHLDVYKRQVLKNLQDSVAGQRKLLADQLLERAANLRYNNSIVTRKINQILRDIEEEEVNASLERMQNKQKILRETSLLIAGIAIVSVVIVIIFIFMITRDISKSKYYRMQLEKAKQYAEDLLHSREKMMLTISPVSYTHLFVYWWGLPVVFCWSFPVRRCRIWG